MSSSQQKQIEKLCRFYNTQKGCANGDQCNFTHSDQAVVKNIKTRTCKFFVNNNCNKGDACPFLHEQPVPKDQTPCRFEKLGGCKKGDECQFMHCN